MSQNYSQPICVQETVFDRAVRTSPKKKTEFLFAELRMSFGQVETSAVGVDVQNGPSYRRRNSSLPSHLGAFNPFVLGETDAKGEPAESLHLSLTIIVGLAAVAHVRQCDSAYRQKMEVKSYVHSWAQVRVSLEQMERNTMRVFLTTYLGWSRAGGTFVSSLTHSYPWLQWESGYAWRCAVAMVRPVVHGMSAVT